MKVLMLSWEYPPHNVGGLGKHVTELVPALGALGVEVHLLTPRWVGGMGEEVVSEFSTEELARGAVPPTVYRVEPPHVEMPDFFTGAWRTNVTLEERGRALIERHGNFDLLHVHDWLVAFAGIQMKHAYKLPLLATIHATEYGRTRGRLESEMSRAIHQVEWWLTYEAWRIICCSRFMAQEVIAAFRAPADKIDVIPNGVDTARFDRWEGVDLTEFRRRYALPEERIIFYVGRIVYEKGVHLLVEAMPQILAAFPLAKLVVAGTGDYLPVVRRRAEELGLGPKVYFTGFVPDEDRDRLFKVADVAAFPSLYEPFGIVALEAMAARTPVVVSEIGGLAEVVRHDETGVTVYPNNVESLAWGILYTLRYPEKARERAARAYELVRREYNWRRIAEQTLAVYERVVRERRAVVW